MRERDKERGLHRGQLESMASQVDCLSGLVRKVEEERDEAMCKVQVLESEQEMTPGREGEWKTQRERESEKNDIAAALRARQDVESVLQEEREERTAAEARCTEMLKKEKTQVEALHKQIAQLQAELEAARCSLEAARNKGGENKETLLDQVMAKEMMLQDVMSELACAKKAAEDVFQTQNEVNKMLNIAQALLAEEREFTNQIASERDSIAKILRELLSLLWQCENERQTSEALIMQDLQGKLQEVNLLEQEVNLLTIKLNTVNCTLVLAQQGAQERQSELLDLSADLAKSRTQAAKDSEEQERVHGELTRVRARNSQLQDEGTGVKERLIRQTEFVTERLGLLAMVRNPHFVFTCLVRPPVACAHACADVCVACAHAFADVCG